MTTISDIDRQIEELQKQKKALIDAERRAALQNAQDAVKALNGLGFNYVLTERSTPKRRTGVRNDVLAAISSESGVTPAEVATKLGMIDKAGKQSVSNAITALKKAGKIQASEGRYTAV